MKVKIAEHEITIYAESDLLKRYKSVDKFPQEYLRLNVLAFYAWWNKANDPRSWLEIAGRDMARIDMAVPQEWWDHYYEFHKQAPKACWSYEVDRFAGRPLMWDEVREQVRAKIAVAVKRFINQAMGEGTL